MRGQTVAVVDVLAVGLPFRQLNRVKLVTDRLKMLSVTRSNW